MSPKTKFDPSIHDDNPDRTSKDFAKSRPAEELPLEILSPFKNKPGRPKLENPKQPVKKSCAPAWTRNVLAPPRLNRWRA